jgi:hypothetical protein
MDKPFSYTNHLGKIVRRLDLEIDHALRFRRRSLALQNSCTARRLATIDALTRGIAENLPRGLPGLIDVPVAENRATASQIADGTTYGFSSTTPANHYRHRYSLYGGDWDNFFSTDYLNPIVSHNGNGSDPSANPIIKDSSVVRFATFADKFEVRIQNYLGFRVKVNGKYLKTGMYGVSALNGDAASGRWFLFDFAGTEFAGQGLKLVELQGYINFRFAGARVPMGYTVQPWPQAIPLKAALHGDSKVDTVIDTVHDYRTALHGLMPQVVQTLTGISDVWVNNIGGTGFIADNGGALSNFIEQAGVDFTGAGFDLVWECGSVNDAGLYASEEAYQAIVESWIEIVLADNPDTILILTGPLPKGSVESYQSDSAIALMQRAKKAAAARFPRNCAFIETCGNAVTDDPWIFGTGNVGAEAGDGNADLIQGTGSGQVHFSTYGHQAIGARLVAETAKVLPLLASRVRDGVVAGVNDLDIA